VPRPSYNIGEWNFRKITVIYRGPGNAMHDFP